MKKTIISFILSIFFLQSNFGYAIVIFDKVNPVDAGMAQSPLNEEKINYFQKYLLQNRDNKKTSTIMEAGKSKIIELDKNNLYQLRLLKQKGVIKDINDTGNYEFSYGKAIYDANIAIVESANPTPGEGRYSYEGPYYCDLLISSLAKFQKIGNNICLADYTAFDSEYTKNPDRTYVSMIKAEELSTADLSKFGIIIFPDIVLGKHGSILDYIGTNGISNIKNFANNGGITIFSSKSIILAQKMNLLNNAVDENTLIKHHLNQGKIIAPISEDFNTQALNFGLYEGTDYTAKVGSGYYDYLLGSYLISPNTDQSIVPIRYFDIKDDENYYMQDITTSEDVELDADELISAFYKPYGKGYIIYNGGNSLFSPSNGSHNLFVNHILNGVIFGFLREVYTSAKVIQKSNPDLQDNLVPALEKDIIFEYDFDGTNVFKETVKNLTLNITLANQVNLETALPAGCSQNLQNIICTKDVLNSSEKWDINFNIKISDPAFTQAGKNIQTTTTNLSYTNSNQIDINQNLGAQTIDAADSAQIRGSLNFDPAGYYPLPGEGVYIDHVVNAENKRSTEAMDVQYTTIVPLISPIVQENDQKLMTYKIKFSKDYYNNLYNASTKTNYYPFKNIGDCAVVGLNLDDRCKDFVIPGLLTDKEYIYVDNYDEPIYKQSSNDDEAMANVNPDFISGKSLGGNIQKQSFFPDADQVMQHAKPRRMVFEYPAKKEVLFARQDIYFRDNPAYPLPKGITNTKSYITLDKRTDINGKICNSNLIQKPGSYEYPTGVIANEYANALECDTARQKITRDNLPSEIEKTYYLHPIDPKNEITGPTDLEGFDNEGNYIGVQNDIGETSYAYNIKFVRGNYAHFYIPEKSTLNGGYIEFDLPNGINPSEIYMLADHVAVNKIERNGQNVKIYFYRGKMPNEQTLKSEFGIALENITTAIGSIQMKIYSLNYDISNPDNINKYVFEQNINTTFDNYNFFKLPSVKLKFDMPRRKRINSDVISGLNLTEGQISVLFDSHEFFKTALIFKATSIGALNRYMSQAGITNADTKTALTTLFTNTPTESYLRKRENLEPFVRFGMYIQELAFHRSVYGPAEDHPIKDPGIMVDSALFITVFNIGNSPIPFREYLTTGISQIIPMATSNTMILYKDIFGREFATPMRTLLPEAAPLPPPIRNFMMNTTFEIYDQNGNIQDTWDGESELEVRENIKLYNNYPKYFNPTGCKDNTTSIDGKEPAVTDTYGQCYDGQGTNTSGYSGSTNYTLLDQNLDATDFWWIRNARLFDTRAEYSGFLTDLQNQLALSGLNSYDPKTLTRAADGKGNITLLSGEKLDDEAHNYSPEIELFYPMDYIANNMWNLTHFDYDDSIYAKGYPYHMDNHLPNPDESITLPQNFITIPTYKGVGYKMKYFSQEPSYGVIDQQNYGKITHNLSLYNSWKYSGRTGWRPENLQNSDDTLLAGQNTVNTIPYAYTDPSTNYVKDSLINTSNFTRIASDQIKNIYTCLFNPYSLNSSNEKYFFKANVVLNNVIPMIPWIQKENENSSYLTNHNCNGQIFSPEQLYQVNNIVETQDTYWKYFAVNLRGQSKEAFNLIQRLQKIVGTDYEGDVKVVEGGRFVYRNPAFGPNLFEIVDNPVSIIKSVISNLSIEKELLPYTLKNYKTDAYLLYTIKDPTEIFTDTQGNITPRPWKDEVYKNSKGAGNYSSSIYVGSSYNLQATKSLLSPGEKTLIQLDIYNNAGYDWNMLGTGTIANDNGQFKTYISGGIDFVITGQAALNANDLIMKVVRNVLVPTKYNFININIPEEIKPYITLTPSDANILTPGTFFDFDFVNITTIRDGFKGVYFLDLQISDTIPDNLRGKVYDISFSINPEYFDHVPGVNGKDPVNWPNQVPIPNARFAIADTGNNAYYINGYSTGINLNVLYNSGFSFDKAYQINEEGLNQLRLAAGDSTKKHQRLREVFESLQNSGYVLKQFDANNTNNTDDNELNINFEQNGINQFPYVDTGGNIQNQIYVLVHITKDELPDGEYVIEKQSKLNFINYAGKSKESIKDTLLKGYSQGPKLGINYKYGLVGQNTNNELEIQKLYPGTNYLKVKVFLKNDGTDIAFDPEIKVNVANGVSIDTARTQNADIQGNQIIIRNLYSGDVLVEGEAIGPGITNYFPIYLTYDGVYQENPVSLIDSASYQFTPFDEALPPLSGSYTTGFTLNFVKTEVVNQIGTLDTNTNYLSGNTLGLYWDMSEGTNTILNKAGLSGSNVFVQSLSLDPTVIHTLNAKAFFKDIVGNFVQIGNHNYEITAENPYIYIQNLQKQNANKLNLTIKTNKLGKYNGYYSINASQGDYTSELVQTTNNGTISTSINNVDITKLTNINLNLYSGSELLTGTTLLVSAENPAISNTSAQRQSDNININFQTNKIYNSCFKIKRDDEYITECKNINGFQDILFEDKDIDVFKDYHYVIEIYDLGDLVNILTTSDIFYASAKVDNSKIPTKIMNGTGTNEDIIFNKFKDLGDTFIVDGTEVRFAAKLQANGTERFTQSNFSGDIKILFSSGFTIYAGSGWDKKINIPTTILGNDFDLSGYNLLKLIQAGNGNVSIVFDNFHIVVLENIWDHPTKVLMEHQGEISEIMECATMEDLLTGSCFFYDTNRVMISTKKFSKFAVYSTSPIIPPIDPPVNPEEPTIPRKSGGYNVNQVNNGSVQGAIGGIAGIVNTDDQSDETDQNILSGQNMIKEDLDFKKKFTSTYITKNYPDFEKLNNMVFESIKDYKNIGIDHEIVENFINSYGYVIYKIKQYKNNEISKEQIKSIIDDFAFKYRYINKIYNKNIEYIKAIIKNTKSAIKKDIDN